MNLTIFRAYLCHVSIVNTSHVHPLIGLYNCSFFIKSSTNHTQLLPKLLLETHTSLSQSHTSELVVRQIIELLERCGVGLLGVNSLSAAELNRLW